MGFQMNYNSRVVWLILPGLGCQWKNMVEGLMDFPIFSDSIRRSAECLKPFDFDLLDLLTEDKNQLIDTIIGSSVGIASVQLALIDLLKALGIVWDGFIGHSAGELMCPYLDGHMTAEELIIVKYIYAKCVAETGLPMGMMAATCLSWKTAKELCPSNVYPACFNSKSSVTISGLYSDMSKFILKLKEKNVPAQKVNTSMLSFHCAVTLPVKDRLIEVMEPFIRPQKRSNKWLSTSVPIDKWSDEEYQYSTAEYHATNIVVPCLFYQCTKLIPKDAIVIEIGPDSLFKKDLMDTVGDKMSYISLMKKNKKNSNMLYLLNAIKQFDSLGLKPNLEKLK